MCVCVCVCHEFLVKSDFREYVTIIAPDLYLTLILFYFAIASHLSGAHLGLERQGSQQSQASQRAEELQMKPGGGDGDEDDENIKIKGKDRGL